MDSLVIISLIQNTKKVGEQKEMGGDYSYYAIDMS